MSPYHRNQFLIEQLHSRIEAYDPLATGCVPHLLEYDLPHLIAALNDDTYILHLVHKINEQLKYRYTWSKEMIDTYPF